ncbi:hypothetical protein AB685_17740 [Bacillus sp. LL01]|uniref:hypothetical protein n=1 Tax=Bacillus sp. LL01 TaxID=1665556 RepID=UPI00064D4A04|nr:hypothetical protein [Bacillus sp. LL01]KMJ57244.1 hypothetical protein AB685_17740 [Bacillus sp. LL01]
MMEIITVVGLFVVSHFLAKTLLKMISRKVKFQKGKDTIAKSHWISLPVVILTIILMDRIEIYFSADYGLIAFSSILMIVLTIFLWRFIFNLGSKI